MYFEGICQLLNKSIKLGNTDFFNKHISKLEPEFKRLYKMYDYDFKTVKVYSEYSNSTFNFLDGFIIEEITDEDKPVLKLLFKYLKCALESLEYGSYEQIKLQESFDEFSLMYLMYIDDNYNGNDFVDDLLKYFEKI